MDLSEAILSAEERPAAYVVAPTDLTYLYKGACRNLRSRLKDHHKGSVSRTRNHRPLKLVYFEYCETYSAALKREKYFKTGTGRDFIRKRIQ